MPKVKVKEMMAYSGHSARANGTVDLTLKAKYSELVNTISLHQMLNNDVRIDVKMGNEKPFSLGVFRIKNISTSGDGESTVKFTTLNDYCDTDSINKLITTDEFRVLMSADVDLEDEEGGK